MTTNSACGIGSSSITTLGAVGTGVWQATPVTVPFGGTGDSSFTAYSILCGGTTSTGVLQNVSGLGSSGQVLTSNGASALPTWQSGASGGLIKITSITASNQATVSFNSEFSSSYDCYLFTFTNVQPVTNAVTLYCEVGTGSGPSWITSGYYWNANVYSNTSVVASHNENDTQAQIVGPAAGYSVINSSAGVNGFIYVFGPNGSSNFVTSAGRIFYTDPYTTVPAISNCNFFNAAANYTSIKFYFSSGNVNSGTICMYGVTP